MPCVGHKDDESPAQNIKLSNSPVLIILYELNLSFYLNILFSLINIITITLRKLASILSAVDLAYKNTEYSRLNCCIVFNNPNKQQAKHIKYIATMNKSVTKIVCSYKCVTL